MCKLTLYILALLLEKNTRHSKTPLSFISFPSITKIIFIRRQYISTTNISTSAQNVRTAPANPAGKL